MMNMGNTARIPSIPSSKSYAFTYNAFGQRTGVSCNYFINPSDITPVVDTEVISYNKEFGYDSAGRLIFETTAKTFHSGATSSVKIVFFYDESSMVGFEYITADGTNIYYYLRNLQGDVIGIYDTSGNLVVKYNYDSWGNCTVASGTTNQALARANPMRYRGYYYDEGTKLYYLNARYYSPEWRRFISPDDTSYLDPETPNGLNLYCYCNNDPVNYADPSGHMPDWAKWLIGGLIIAGLTIATIATGGAAGGVAGFILTGALKGAILGAVSDALVSGVIEGVSFTINGDGFWDGFATGAASGFMSGAIVGGITGAISSGVQVFNASKLWANTGNKTAYRQMVNHYQNHVIKEGQKAVAKNIVKYSKDAYQFFQSNSMNAQIINTQLGVVKIAGAPGGIYNSNGLIRSF